MKRFLLLIGMCVLFASTGFGQSAGDIAFIGFNSDGNKDLSIVALADIPNTTIYFTDNEWDSTAFTTGEGALAWVTGGTISAGTVVTFSDVNATVTVSSGSVTEPDAGFNPTNGSEAIYAFLGTDDTTPTTFLAAISNRAFDDGTIVGTLFGTGLTEGTEAVNLGDTDLDADVGAYNSFKQALSKSDFLALIGNASNWTTDDGSGDQSGTFLPFSTTAFEFTNEREITGDAGWRLLSLPIENWDLSDISDDTAIQGVTGGSNAAADTNVATFDASGIWEIPASVTTEIPEGTGIAVYFFNNTTAGSSTLPITLDASGSEPSSDVVVDLYSGATGRYTLVGNPFASNVDLANVSANIGISSNMTFWDNTAGSYTTENISGGLVIEPWQGYWVQTANSTSGGQLTFGTADKTSSASDTTHFDKKAPTSLRELSFSIKSSYNTEKNLKLQIADEASESWDLYDLVKLGSLLPQNVSAAFIGELEGKTTLKGIESIPSSLENEITIPIMVDLVGESQTLKMSWSGLANLPEDWTFKLHDYVTEESFDLRSVETYDFDISVVGSNQKANPISILNSVMGQEMKFKSNQTPRFGITITPSVSSVGVEPGDEPTAFALAQNYPNPFNPSTTINYSVKNTGAVTLSVYNLMGQKVAELVNETKSAGSYNVTWNASQAASGMYYYRLEAGGQTLTRKMTLIK